jgi:uncharacterized repeat protein (TIGR02543 family)
MKNFKVLPLILVIVFIFAFFQSPAKPQASGIPAVLAQESFGTIVQAQPVAQAAPARQIAMTEPQRESQKTQTKAQQLAAEKTKAEPMAGNIKKMKPGRDYVADEVLVSAANEQEAKKAAAAYGAQLKSYSKFGFAVLTLPKGKTVRAAIEQGASKDNALPVAYPNNYYKVSEAAVAYTPDDPEIDDQYYHREMGDGLAWDITKGTSDVVVAVIDTGIDTDHPEFTGRISSLSYNAYTGVAGISAVQDDYNHGSHVAGIIAAAQDNAAGGCGIAPGVTIMAIKANIPNQGSFSTDDLIESIKYAADNGADIINMSLGRSYDSGIIPLEQSAIQDAQNKGALVVCAAGNERDDHAGYPAAYAECVAVSALKAGQVFDDTYSNYGPEVDISAAGTNIYSTVPNDTYSEKSGTSMATPMVCGVAALIKSQNPDMTPAQLKQKLYDTAIDKGQQGRDDEYGYGAVSAVNALSSQFCTVTFDSQGGSEVLPLTVVKGAGTTEPPPPGRIGYAFAGWYKQPDCQMNDQWGFISQYTSDYEPFTTDITLYARWMAGEYRYTEQDGKLTITDYYGPEGDVVIPDSIDGKTVAVIGTGAFGGRNVTSVTVPDSVTEIGQSAFVGCAKLKTVHLGANVQTIGETAFANCYRLTGIDIPDKVTSIGRLAFWFCDNLQHVSLGSGLKTIGETAFSMCIRLEGINIPDSVTTLSRGVFVECHMLQTATLPAGLKAIPAQLFFNAWSLAGVTIPEGVETIGESAFSGCIAMTQVTIPDSVTSIGKFAFSWSADYEMGLQTVTIGNGVKSIGDLAFQLCTSLSTIKMGGNVESIGEYAFSYCTSLSSIKFPKKLASLGKRAFQMCTSLNSVYFYGNAPVTGTDLFASCPAIVYYISGKTGFTNPWKERTASTFVPADTFLVKFNLNGAPGEAPAVQTCAYRGKAARPANPARTGYNFMGWVDNPACTGEVWDFESNEINWDTTLYAKWEGVTYTVTLNAQEGTVGPQTLQVTYGSAYGTLPTPIREHYNFDGWYTEENGAGQKITAESHVWIDADHTLYANWIQTFTVTLDAGEGTVSPETLQVTFGSAYGTLPTPAREHYNFDGWYTGENGTGDNITPESIVSIAADHTLYANWNQNFKVTLSAQGGTVTPETLNVTYGSAYGELPTPEREHYRFEGWYTGENGTGAKITADTAVETAADHTLYAYWRLVCTVTLDAQGGTVTPKTVQATYGSAYGELPTPDREHYLFEGWYTGENGSGDKVTADTTVAIDMDHTLYAYWKRLYAVTLDAQGGTVEPQTLTVTYWSVYGELPTPEREHYKFEGWYTGENGSGQQIAPNKVVLTAADHTLYAYWKKWHTVTLDAQGGTVSPQTVMVTLWDVYGELPTPVREHCRFDGWYTEQNGVGGKVTEGSYSSQDCDHTLYANWIFEACSVEFDSMEGSAVQTQTVAYGEKAVKPQNPSRDGFVFAGWYKEDGYIHEWNFQTETVTADIMLFAKWNVRVSITFEKSDVSQGGRADGCITLMASGGAAGQYEYSIHNGASWQEGNVFNGLKEGTYYGVARDKSDVTNVSAAAKIVIAAIKPAFVQVKVSCKKTNATLLGAANGKIILTASGGSSGKYLYSINGGRTWQTSPSFNVAAGSYSAAVCDTNDRANSVRVSVTIHEPRFAGRFLASKMPSKAVCGTGIIIAAPTSPRGYTLKFISYVSGNTKTAYVDKKGNVTFLAGGSVKLTVTSVFKAAGKKDKTIKYTKTIAVTQLISSIAMSKTATVYVNKKITLAAKISPATATNKKLKWTSGNTRIATVSSSGVVTGKAKGTVVIKCTAQDGSKVYASCTVTVK